MSKQTVTRQREWNGLLVTALAKTSGVPINIKCVDGYLKTNIDKEKRKTKQNKNPYLFLFI